MPKPNPKLEHLKFFRFLFASAKTRNLGKNFNRDVRDSLVDDEFFHESRILRCARKTEMGQRGRVASQNGKLF